MPLPTHLLVSATITNALAAGVYITVIKKGDETRGTLYVRVDNRAGDVKLYQQIFDGDKSQLVLHSSGDAVATAVARTIANDPDVWVVDVEDREGRVWFDAAF